VLTAFRLQLRVIMALVIREINTRYGRENIGFLWIIGEPILFVAGVTIAWSMMRPALEHGLPMPAIVLTGYVPLTMWRHCLGRSVKAYEANGALMFHRQVTPLDIITARCFLEIVGVIMAAAIVLVAGVVVGAMEWPIDWGLVYLGVLMQALFCYATALLMASLSEYSDVAERAVGILSYLAIPFSGAFTMVDWLSPQFQQALLWSPSVNNVEMIRAGMFGASAHSHFDLIYDLWITALMIVAGLHLTMRVRSRILVQ